MASDAGEDITKSQKFLFLHLHLMLAKYDV